VFIVSLITYSQSPSFQFCFFLFSATVVHELDEYWLNVTSPRLQFDVNCVFSAAVETTTTSVILSNPYILTALVARVLPGM